MQTETGFVFSEWQAKHNAKIAARRLELETAFRMGLIVRQFGTFWSTAGVIHTRFGVRADAAFIEPYQSDPVYLADHLCNREFGFGFETVILRASLAA